MRTVNTKPDSYLIQCIEIDLYDLLYKCATNQLKKSLVDEVHSLMKTYQKTNAINNYNVVHASSQSIIINVFSPGKKQIVCQTP